MNSKVEQSDDAPCTDCEGTGWTKQTERRCACQPALGMTPATIRAHLATLGWSQRGLADALQRDDRLIRRWLSGDAPIPADAAAWIERAARELGPWQETIASAETAIRAWHEENPPPARNSG